MTNRTEICGYFSITAGGEYEDSISALRYFRRPRLPIDLNRGIKDIKPRVEFFYENRLNCILKFLVNHKHEFLNKTESAEKGDRLIPCTDYITLRQVLCMICCSSVESWRIFATKYKGNIYLRKYMTDDEIEKNIPHGIYRKFTDYGLMFQHRCLSEHPDEKPGTSQAYDSNQRFCCVVKKSLVNRQFLFGTEMDGAYTDTPLDARNPRGWKTSQFVKIKLNIELTTRNRITTFHSKKVPKIWAQCYLTGIEELHLGFRDNDGIVWQKRRYSLDELGKITRENLNGSQSAEEFLDYFLNIFEDDLRGIDCPYTTIKYHYDADAKRLSSTKHEGKSECSILPEWYIEEMK